MCSMSSCFEATQIQGNYGGNNTFTSDKKVDEVWGLIIDLFSSKGISIKVIDKQSGLIISERASFIRKRFDIAKLTGDWNIRVKEFNGKTLVTVNLVNIDASFYSPPTTYSSGGDIPLNAKSTGVFEKLILDIIK